MSRIYGIPAAALAREVLDRCHQLHDRASGRLFVQLQPGRMSEDAVATAVLVALGKRPHDRGRGIPTAATWRRVCAWLRGEQIRELFVAPFENTFPHVRAKLLAAAQICDVDLYVFRAGDGRRWWNRLLLQWEIEEISETDFLATHPPRSAAPPPPDRYPGVPDSDLTRFRWDAARNLPATEFKRVDATFTSVREETLAWRADHLDPSPEETAELCESVLRGCTSYNEALTAIRAVEASFRLTNTKSDLIVAGSRFAQHRAEARPEDLDHGLAERLRWYASTDLAALALTRVVSGCSVEALVATRFGDLDPSGAAVCVGGHDYAVSPSGRGIYRAHYLHRDADGAAEQDAAFMLQHSNGARRRVDVTTARRWLTDASHFCDAGLSDRFAKAKTLSGRDWLTAHGLRLVRTVR